MYLRDLQAVVLHQPDRLWACRVLPRTKAERAAIIRLAKADYLYWRPDNFCLLVGNDPAIIAEPDPEDRRRLAEFEQTTKRVGAEHEEATRQLRAGEISQAEFRATCLRGWVEGIKAIQTRNSYTA